MPLRATSQDHQSNRSQLADRTSLSFYVFWIIALLIGVLGWLFRCDLGIGNCIYVLHGIEIEFVKKSKKDTLLSAHLDAPCNVKSKWALSQKLSEELPSADLSMLWMNWGTEKNCNISNADRASHYVEAYRYARDSGDRELANQAIIKSFETLPTDPQILLTAAEHHYNYDDKQRAIEFYKLATHYAGGYQNIGTPSLWTFAAALDEVQKPCEALGLLSNLAARTKNNQQVRVKIDKIRGSGRCKTQNRDPILLTQNAEDQFLAAVTINGSSGVFLVDTGASITTLSAKFAKRLGYIASPLNAMAVMTANGISYATPKVVQTLIIGSETLDDQTVLVSKSDFGEIDGLLGMDVLAQFDFDKNGTMWTLKRRFMN